MPRNASGNYTLPLPSVVTGTVIESLWANTTMNDLAASVTDSLDRYGRGGMVAPFRMVDGTVAAPAISFTSETNTGLYRPSSGVISVSVLGAEKQTWTSAATTIGVDVNVLGDFNVLGAFEIDGDILLADDKAIGWGANGTRIAGNDTTDTITFFTNALERMRIASNGTVGIGTNNPQARLHVKTGGELIRMETTTARGGGQNYIRFIDPTGTSGFLGFAASDDNFYVRNDTAVGNLLLGTNAAERMRIAPNGFVSIGTSVSLQRLYVGAGGSGTNTELIVVDGGSSGSGGGASVGVYNGGTYKIAIGNKSNLLGGAYDPHGMVITASDLILASGGAERMRFLASGLIGVGGTPTVGSFEVISSGAGIISKASIENGTVAHLGVWNLNPNTIQWYITCNGSATEQHTPRGNHNFFIAGVNRMSLSGTFLITTVPIAHQTGSDSMALFGQTQPYIRWFYSGVIEWWLQAKATGALEFTVGGTTPRVTITNGGALLVGQVSPGLSNSNSMTLEGPVGYCVFNHVVSTPNGTNFHYFAYGGTTIGSVSQATTGSVAFNTTSDARLKTAVEDMTDQGAVIDAIRPCTFEWIADPGPRYQGFIAQELYEVVPEAVTQVPVPDKDDVVWSVDFSKLVPLLVREVQSLRARVAALGG